MRFCWKIPWPPLRGLLQSRMNVVRSRKLRSSSSQTHRRYKCIKASSKVISLLFSHGSSSIRIGKFLLAGRLHFWSTRRVAWWKEKVFPRPEWDKVWRIKGRREVSYNEIEESQCSCSEILRLHRSMLRLSCKARRRENSSNSNMWISSGNDLIWRPYRQNISSLSKVRRTTRKPKDNLTTRSNTCLHQIICISLLAGETQAMT